MAWGYASVTLACGCEVGTSLEQWDKLWVGDYQQCRVHGDTEVVKMARVREASASKSFQLGIAPQTQETQDVSIE